MQYNERFFDKRRINNARRTHLYLTPVVQPPPSGVFLLQSEPSLCPYSHWVGLLFACVCRQAGPDRWAPAGPWHYSRGGGAGESVPPVPTGTGWRGAGRAAERRLRTSWCGGSGRVPWTRAVAPWCDRWWCGRRVAGEAAPSSCWNRHIKEATC